MENWKRAVIAGSAAAATMLAAEGETSGGGAGGRRGIGGAGVGVSRISLYGFAKSCLRMCGRERSFWIWR